MKRKNGNPALAGRSAARDRDRAGPKRAFIETVAVCCVLALLFTGTFSAAKKKKPLTKTIQGQVFDQDNNPLVGASVELTDVTSGKTLGIYAEEGGRYHFTDLKPIDDYQVRAAYKGQQSDVRHVSALDDEAVRVLNLTIPAPASQ